MKKVVLTTLVIILALFIAPISINAHGDSHGNELDTQQNIMQYIEEQNLKGDTHKELETLIEKIQKGNMTTKEADRMADLIEQHSGVSTMMMERMMGENHTGESSNMHKDMPMMQNQGIMQGQGWINAFIWIGFISYVVWLIVGVLLIIFLWKKLYKGKE